VFTVHSTATSVADLIREAVTSMELTLSGHRVVMIIPESLPLVDADPLLIGQVLVNLLDNANRYSPPEGDIIVEGRQDGARVLVSVTDQGPGIPVDQRDEVFHQFARLDKGGRAGLGLTIAKTFVEAHGEHIWYEDAATRGARFVFSLPVVAAPNGEG
jgi:two-component system sensor histidine kinase KdpD